MNFRRRDRRRGEDIIDLTPMIDVIFQLLIFFMVTTTFITNPGLRLDLPRSSRTELQEKQRDLTVVMLAQEKGAVFFRGKRVALDGLKKALSVIAAKNRGAMIFLQAERAVSHGRVVKVISIIKETGLTRVGIVTEKE